MYALRIGGAVVTAGHKKGIRQRTFPSKFVKAPSKLSSSFVLTTSPVREPDEYQKLPTQLSATNVVLRSDKSLANDPVPLVKFTRVIPWLEQN